MVPGRGPEIRPLSRTSVLWPLAANSDYTRPPMETPILIFDHVHKVVAMTARGPETARKLEEIVAAGKAQVSGASTAPPHA
jgi:hypothetical protein